MIINRAKVYLDKTEAQSYLTDYTEEKHLFFNVINTVIYLYESLYFKVLI